MPPAACRSRTLDRMASPPAGEGATDGLAMRKERPGAEAPGQVNMSGGNLGRGTTPRVDRRFEGRRTAMHWSAWR